MLFGACSHGSGPGCSSKCLTELCAGVGFVHRKLRLQGQRAASMPGGYSRWHRNVATNGGGRLSPRQKLGLRRSRGLGFGGLWRRLRDWKYLPRRCSGSPRCGSGSVRRRKKPGRYNHYGDKPYGGLHRCLPTLWESPHHHLHSSQWSSGSTGQRDPRWY